MPRFRLRDGCFYSFGRDLVTVSRHVVDRVTYDIDARMAAHRVYLAVKEDDGTAADIYDFAAMLEAILKRRSEGDRIALEVSKAAERLLAWLVFHSPWKPSERWFPIQTLSGFPFNCDPYVPVDERELYTPADDAGPTGAASA